MSMRGSGGIYKPIRVLFDTPVYKSAVNTCWYLQGYKTQIAMMMEFLRLQQGNQIPPHITAEDMITLLVEESKKTLREQLWEFQLEDLEDQEAKPLLKLLWAVNVINKMRDTEFQARMLLKFPEATPPKFQTPQLLSMVTKYTEILKEKQQETQTSRLLTAQEVVIEVVPRVLQGFWELPPHPLLNIASQSLRILSTSVKKATLDRVSKVLTALDSQAIFSLSIRDDVVHTILTDIREQYPLNILLSSIANFAPVLLTAIADVTKNHICKIFQPQISSKPDHHTSSEPPTLSEVHPSEESPAKSPSLSEGQPSEELPVESLPMSEVHPSEEPPAEPPSLSEGQPSEEPPVESLPMSEVHPSEEPPAEPPSLSEGHPSEEPPVEAPSLCEVHHSEEPPAECPLMSEAVVPVISITENSQELKTEKKEMGFFQKLLRTL